MNGHGDRDALTARLVATRAEKTQTLTAGLRMSLNGNHKPRQFWRERACPHRGRLRFVATEKSSGTTCPRFDSTSSERWAGGAKSAQWWLSPLCLAEAPHDIPLPGHCRELRLPCAQDMSCASPCSVMQSGYKQKHTVGASGGWGGEYITSAFKNEIGTVPRIASALTSAKHLCQTKVLHAPGPKASTHSDECCKLRDIMYYIVVLHGTW